MEMRDLLHNAIRQLNSVWGKSYLSYQYLTQPHPPLNDRGYSKLQKVDRTLMTSYLLTNDRERQRPQYPGKRQRPQRPPTPISAPPLLRLHQLIESRGPGTGKSVECDRCPVDAELLPGGRAHSCVRLHRSIRFRLFRRR